MSLFNSYDQYIDDLSKIVIRQIHDGNALFGYNFAFYGVWKYDIRGYDIRGNQLLYFWQPTGCLKKNFL